MVKWEELNAEQQLEVERQMELIGRGVAEIVPEEELKAKVIQFGCNWQAA